MEECCLCTTTNHLYPLKCPGDHMYCLSCIKGIYLSSTLMNHFRCPECRHEPKRQHLIMLCEEPHRIKQISRETLLATIEEKPYVWLYEGRNNGWWYYDYDMQDILEDTYNSGKKILEWVVCGQKISLDLVNMIQTNNDNQAMRSIKRTVPQATKNIIIKGVAGMA